MNFRYDDYIDLLISKDEQAFNLIYEHSSRTVFAVIRSIIKDQALAEDAMQETYIKAITKIRSYKKNGKFLSWISSIAYHTAIDAYRDNKNVIALDPSENEDLYKSETPTYDKQALVEELLSKLDDESRTIVMMHVIGELTFRNISEIINKPLGTVLWLYNKAMKQLREEAGRWKK